jgi:hypothetical protein
MERDLLEGAAELIKKDPGVSLQKLSMNLPRFAGH